MKPLLALALAIGAAATSASLVVESTARAQRRPTLAERAKALEIEMVDRGESPGEISLSLASLHAESGDAARVDHHLKNAQRLGVDACRIDLLLGSFYRRTARFDAAISTFVRVLVSHEDQPFALVQLWKTLYQIALQDAEVSSDLDSVRERLDASGLHFPRTFKPSAKGPARSRQITAAGYNALLSGKNTFAAELFEAAIEGDPSNAQAHRGLGIARAREKDYARAAGAYLLYLELRPDAADAAQVERALMDHWKSRSAN
jgi:tetratricopeptide (TPR) repeat protein